jgi:hypothetical protein
MDFNDFRIYNQMVPVCPRDKQCRSVNPDLFSFARLRTGNANVVDRMVSWSEADVVQFLDKEFFGE